MHALVGRAPFVAAFVLCALALDAGAAAQDERNERSRESATRQEPPGEPDIVVRGRRREQLRIEVEIAQEALYARFNDINSDDRFDIHCYSEQRYASKMKERRCQSNSWREQEANIGEETLRAMRGEASPGDQQFRSEQLYVEQLIFDEMRRLALQDDELKKAVLRLGYAQIDLAEATGRPPDLTREREVFAGDQGLPFGAERVFEVLIGDAPWSIALTQRTFTVAQVSGEIRGIELDCSGERQELDYEVNVEWTVPRDWNACIVRVRAERDTTFAFYEF
jgi:hypothetical protein